MRVSTLPLLASLLTLSACASAPPATPAAAPAAPPPPAPAAAAPAQPASDASGRVDGGKAHELVKAGALLVDVRTTDEYVDKHIDQAINVPVDDVAAHDFGAKDTPLVLYCQKGGRSERAAQVLRAKGYTRVYVLGPMSAWER